MKSIKWLMLLAVGLWSQLAIAQSDCDLTMSGQVLDLASGEPLAFVTVLIEGTQQGVITDEEGHFTLTQLCKKEFNLVFSSVGYKRTVHHHDPYHASPTIYLAQDNQLLHSVIVESDYNPPEHLTWSAQGLDESLLHANQQASFGELASKLTGVTMMSTGQNIIKPMIHGLHSNRILIINNGVRHEFQNWGVEHAPEIDPSFAETLEVVKGAATVRYGPDALGGVLILSPAKLELSTGWNGKAGLSAATNGRSGELNLEIKNSKAHWVYGVNGSILRQGDLHTPDYQLTNTGKKEYAYSGFMRYHKGKLDVEANYSRFYQQLGILRAAVNGNLTDLETAITSAEPPDTQPFSYVINNPRQEVTHDLLKVKGSRVWDNQKWTLQYAFQRNDRQEYDVRRGTNRSIPAIDLQLVSHSLDLDWYHPNWGVMEGLMGAQWIYQDNSNIFGTNTAPFVPNYNNNRLGLFLIESWPAGEGTLELGVRYDYQFLSLIGRQQDQRIFRNEMTYNQVTSSLGYIKKLNTAWEFQTNIGSAWRPPNVSELYSFGRHQATFEYGLWRYQINELNEITVDDVLTQAERPVKPEMGLKWINTFAYKKSQTQMEISGFMNYIENYIYTRPAGITTTVRGAFPYFVYDQTNALMWGADAAIQHSFSSVWDVRGELSSVWARDLSNQDYFIGIPPVMLNGTLGWHDLKSFLSSSNFQLDVRYTFRQLRSPRIITVTQLLDAAENDQNLFESNDDMFDFLAAPKGFFLVDLRWSGSWDNFGGGIQIQNVLNTNYRSYTDRLRYFADEQGRNFKLSLNYNF